MLNRDQLAPALLIAFLSSCASTQSDGFPNGTDVRSSADSELPADQRAAAYALLDRGVTFRATTDIDAPLEDQAKDVAARLEATEGEEAAALRLELATLYLGLAIEHGDRGPYYIAMAKEHAEEAVFAFGDGTEGGYAAYYVLGQIYREYGDEALARDYFESVTSGLNG